MKGLIIIYTGNGKGKTTAAYGSALRAVGHGLKVKIIQFVKDNKIQSGENKAMKSFGVDVEILGKGFVGILGDKLSIEEHSKSASEALSRLKDGIQSKNYSLIVADEILGAIYSGLIPEAEVIEILKNKSDGISVILTGRNASGKMIKLADTVTEMKEIKHHWQKNILSQKGIEF